MKPTSHHYIALIIALIVLTASLGGFLYIDGQVRNETKETTDTLDKVAKEQTAITKEQSMAETFSSTAIARALLQTYLIPDGNTVSFIEEIEGVAKQSGANVSIASISADDLTSATAGTIGHIQAHISINGSWSEAMRALHIIEDMPYSLTIDDVNVHALGDGVWNVEFNMAGLIVK
jgi:hypothetical protein